MQDADLDPDRSTWLDRLQALLEVLLLSGILSSYVAFLPFFLRGGTEDMLLRRVDLLCAMLLLEAAITLLLIATLLRHHGERWRDLGLLGAEWRTNVAIGLGLVPVLFLTNGLVAVLIRRFLPAWFSEHNALIESIRTPSDLALFALAALVAGGFKEEVQRAFILNRFRDYLGGPRLGLVVWSLAFGAGHYIQGAQGAIAAAIYGLAFGAVYLMRGSLVGPIVAHAVYDLAALMGYWFFRGSAAS
jgi:membrane protease YdiL (CAAX protease family)